MKTENFSLASAGDTWIRQGLVRVLRYDSGDAGGPTPTIRVTSLSGSDIDLEMVPGRIVTLPRPMGGLVIRSLAGAGITGKFTWGEGLVEDNTFSGNFDLTAATINALISAKYNMRPEAATGVFNTSGVLASNTAEQIFAPGANTNGVLLQDAGFSVQQGSSLSPYAVMLSKAGAAPTTIVNGDPVLTAKDGYVSGTIYFEFSYLEREIIIPAGHGLYFLAGGGVGANSPRYARWKTL